MTERSTAQYRVPIEADQPPHDNGVDVFVVREDEGGGVHCLHRSEDAANACAAFFGAVVQEWLIHD